MGNSLTQPVHAKFIDMHAKVYRRMRTLATNEFNSHAWMGVPGVNLYLDEPNFDRVRKVDMFYFVRVCVTLEHLKRNDNA